VFGDRVDNRADMEDILSRALRRRLDAVDAFVWNVPEVHRVHLGPEAKMECQANPALPESPAWTASTSSWSRNPTCLVSFAPQDRTGLAAPRVNAVVREREEQRVTLDCQDGTATQGHPGRTASKGSAALKVTLA